MKKTLIATAVAAGVLATGAAQAQPKVYGILHFSIDTVSDNLSNASGDNRFNKYNRGDATELRSNTSAIGIKGSEDLGGGLKAIYKAEFLVDPFTGGNSSQRDTLERRDIWVGLKGGWGKAAVGTMSSNYKQMGGKIDPLYRTPAEGRGLLNIQSPLHGGAGIDGGRMTNAIQYTTPKMAGVEIVVNTSLGGVDDTGCSSTIGECDETIGAGIRWSNKNWLVFADYIDTNRPGIGSIDTINANAGVVVEKDESAAKIGGKFENDQFQVSAQYEATEDYFLGNYIFLNGWWKINKKNDLTLSYGQHSDVSDSVAVGYVYKMSKQTNVYAAYGTVDIDDKAQGAIIDPVSGNDIKDASILSLGLRKSF